MIERIIEYSAIHRAPIILAAVAAAMVGWASPQHLPLDALPDLSDTQVIVYSRWERSPDIIEDQVTYPLVSALPALVDESGHTSLADLRASA